MACRLGLYAIMMVFLLCFTILETTEGAYLPKQASFSMEALKRSAVSGARQKRYTDYQERASSFCTGLCMYEERKSYSECFDLCNWQMYEPREESRAYYYDDTSVTSSPASSVDYSNDEADTGDTPTENGAGKDSSRDNNSNKPRQKGKKGKNKSALKEERAKNKEKLAEQKQRLRELKRKLIQEINLKKNELSDRAVELQGEIQQVEAEIELNKQTMNDLESRLQNVDQELTKIDELKSNVSLLVKDRRKMLLDDSFDPDASGFLIPESEFSDSLDLSGVLKDFLIHESPVDKRAKSTFGFFNGDDGFSRLGNGGLGAGVGSDDESLFPFPQYGRLPLQSILSDLPRREKLQRLDEALDNLRSVLALRSSS